MSEGYNKKFDEWTHFKEILDSIPIDIPYLESEIWSVAIGVNIDIEIDGKGQDFERPAIIIKTFSRKHAWIVPITRVQDIRDGIHVPIYHKKLYIYSAAVISQLQRTSNCRFLYKIGDLEGKQLVRLKNSIKKHLDIK